MTPNPTDPVIRGAVAAALALSNGLRDRLADSLRLSHDWQHFYVLAMQAIFGFEPSMRRTLEDATFASFIAAGKPLLALLPPPIPQSGSEIVPNPFSPGPSLLTVLERSANYPQTRPFTRPIVLPAEPMPTILPTTAVPPFNTPPSAVEPGGAEPLIRFPLIERAAENLAKRNVVTKATFDAMDLDAKRRAFTVARVQSIETLQGLRDNLAKAVAEGRSLSEFKHDTASILDDAGPLLSEPHLRNVFRTNVASGYAAGQQRILGNPIVNALFPYVRWVAVHDGRVAVDHLAMETAGLDGTGVFRADDPLIRLAWPPARYNCRCHVIILSVKAAAKLGVREAMEWRASGQPPLTPQWVQSIPLKLIPGWVGGSVNSLAV